MIISGIFWRIYNLDSKKKKRVKLAFLFSIIAILNSCIYMIYDTYFSNYLLQSSTEKLQELKITLIEQDYTTLKSALSHFKGEAAINTIIKKKITPIQDKASLENFPTNIQKMLAFRSNKITYYSIDFSKIATTYVKNKDCWLIDKSGNLYLNIDSLDSY